MPATPIDSTLYALIDKQGKCKRTKFTKDMIIAEASVGERIASYRLTKVESVGLADVEADTAEPKAGSAVMD